MKKEDILANCIDEILAEKNTLADCLARYPDLSNELRPLLEIAIGIQPERATPSPEFKLRARNRLLEAMQPPAAHIERRRPGIFGWLKPLAPVKSFPLVAAIVLFVLLAAGGTTAYASQGSLPDDTLYPVKTGVENLQLALTLSPEAKASLHLRLAQRRISEVIAQSNLGRNISTSALEAVAIQIDAAIGEIDSVLPEDTKTLLSQLSELTLDQQLTLGQVLEAAPEATQPALNQAINAARRGNLIAQVAYGNPAFLNNSPSVLDEKLEAAYFELEGTLLSAEDGIWNIGGLLIKNVNSSQKIPPVGSQVEIEGLVQGDQIFISEIEREEEIDNKIKIEGVFGGTSPDGTIWYVGGIPVNQPQNIMPPPEGKKLELKGIIQNGIFTVTEMESEEDKEEGEVEIKGILVQVNHDEKTITIKIAGDQITIDVSETVIKGEDGQILTLSDLESLVGEDIQVKGLYMGDGLLFAKKITVDVEREEETADEGDEDKEGKEEEEEEEEEEDEED
jgi:hypothetical protein